MCKRHLIVGRIGLCKILYLSTTADIAAYDSGDIAACTVADVNRGFTPPFLDAPSRVIYEIAFNNRTQQPARVEEQRFTNTHLRLRDSEVSDCIPLTPG